MTERDRSMGDSPLLHDQRTTLGKKIENLRKLTLDKNLGYEIERKIGTPHVPGGWTSTRKKSKISARRWLQTQSGQTWPSTATAREQPQILSPRSSRICPTNMTCTTSAARRKPSSKKHKGNLPKREKARVTSRGRQLPFRAVTWNLPCLAHDS